MDNVVDTPPSSIDRRVHTTPVEGRISREFILRLAAASSVMHFRNQQSSGGEWRTYFV